MKLLLVGEDTEFLRNLALDLLVHGFTAETVSDTGRLREVLEQSPPELIVFDHVEPLDIYVLNPRESGYAGPLLLLISDNVPESVLDRFQTAHVARKPLALELLSAQIRLVTST